LTSAAHHHHVDDSQSRWVRSWMDAATCLGELAEVIERRLAMRRL
jgi:hypothetical protein